VDLRRVPSIAKTKPKSCFDVSMKRDRRGPSTEGPRQSDDPPRYREYDAVSSPRLSAFTQAPSAGVVCCQLGSFVLAWWWLYRRERATSKPTVGMHHPADPVREKSRSKFAKCRSNAQTATAGCFTAALLCCRRLQSAALPANDGL
jgi:hypothetical protein